MCCVQPAHAVGGAELCDLVSEVMEVVTGEGWEGVTCEEDLLQCLQLQVVGVCVRLLGGAVSVRLERLAYQLLTRAGSPHSAVADQALSTLSTVSSTTGARYTHTHFIA